MENNRGLEKAYIGHSTEQIGMEKHRNKSVHYNDYLADIFREEFVKNVADSCADKINSHTSKPSVRTVTFQVTDACSLACTYCYQINKGTRRMSLETAKLFVDRLISGEKGFYEYLGDTPGIIIEFIGGEPFLEIDLIDQITDYFIKRVIELRHPWALKYMISICSNGVAYTDQRVQRYLQKNRGHVSLSITVDGTKELHDSCRVFPDGGPSYDLAHGAAMDWMNRGNYIGSKITMAPNNVKYIFESLKQMINDGYRDININPVYEDVWSPEDCKVIWQQFKKFSDWMRETSRDQGDYAVSFLDYVWGVPMMDSDNDNWCGGNAQMLSCDPDGVLFPCIRYMESSLGDSREPISIGNLWDGIATTDKDKNNIKRLSCITRRSQSTDQCFYCPIARGCSWCTAYNYQATGDVNKRVLTICDVHKVRAFTVTYYWNNYYYKMALRESDADRRKNIFKNVHDLYVPKEWIVHFVGDEDYNNLAQLTEKMGGYVNNEKMVTGGKGYRVRIAEK